MYSRYIADKIDKSLENSPVVLINGARQVGKSTLCQSLIKSGRFSADYVTLDDPVLRDFARTDPMGFLTDLPEKFILDEIQRAPELFISLKKLIDENRQKRRVILSGSANVLSLPRLGDSLAGRMEIYDLWPLARDEITGKRSAFIDILLNMEEKYSASPVEWQDIAIHLATGGYPESVRRESHGDRASWFESYMRTTLQKDIRDLANIEGLSEIPNILQMLAIRVGSTLNMASISRQTGVNQVTLKRYLSLLKALFLIVQIPAWTPNAEGRFVKSPKMYLNDTGLLSHLTGDLDDDAIYTLRGTAGAALENYVVMEILKQATWFTKRLNFFHFSTHQGAEVDLVIEQGPKRIYGVEVKSSASIGQSDFKGLRKLEELSKGKFQKGIVLYTGERAVSFAQNLQAVPLSVLWS